MRVAIPASDDAARHDTGAAEILGLRICSLTLDQLVCQVLMPPPANGAGATLIATANIQHIAAMRSNPEFGRAMAQADLVTCDGFPVFRYAARRSGRIAQRVTGRELVQIVMARPAFAASARLFFVVDSAGTAAAAAAWAADRGLSGRMVAEVPPPDFIGDAAYCTALAARIAAHGTTILMMCVGAPRSELFVHRHRAVLPSCWALCVGQAVKLALGLVPPPPRWMVRLDLEWLWRLMLEPRRLAGRYWIGAWGFAAAVADDRRRARRRRSAAAPAGGGLRQPLVESDPAQPQHGLGSGGVELDILPPQPR